MHLTYYTVDDLRLPPKRPFRRGWTMERFETLREALAWYRTLPSDAVKSLGLTDSAHVLELARCLPLFPEEREGESIQVSEPRELPLWAECPEAVGAADDCSAALGLRYQLAGHIAVPIPADTKPRKELRDAYLWLSGEGGRRSAIRWAYVAGVGWKQPDFLKNWDCPSTPLVTECQADGITEQGAYLALRVTPWEYQQLLRRTKERQEKENEYE